jgi:phage protein D
MVTPKFRLEANAQDITAIIAKNLTALTITDKDGDEADELSFSVVGLWSRPKYGDKIKIWIGEKEAVYFGEFIVQTSERTDNNILTITASSADFKELKNRRDANYDNMSVSDVVGQIALRYGAPFKCDDDGQVEYLAQANESDAAFLRRLAKDRDAIFSIKNGTLLFLKRREDGGDLPAFEVDVRDCINLRVKRSDKTQYASAVIVKHDTQTNEPIEVTVGSGEPALRIKRDFTDEAEAIKKAKSALDKANRGIVSGSVTIVLQPIFAGGILKLKNSVEDDGEYAIKSVRHDLGSWQSSIEFER